MSGMTRVRKLVVLTAVLLAAIMGVLSARPAVADDKADLQKAVDAVTASAQTGDIEKFLAHFDKEYAKITRELLPFADAMHGMSKACKEKFNKAPPNADRMDMRGSLKQTKSAEILGEPTFEGDTAKFRLKTVVGLPESEETRTEEKEYTATKIDGKWILLEADFSRRREQMEKQLPIFKKLTVVAEQLTEEIKAGKYASLEEVQRAFETQARAAVEKK